MSTLIKEKTLPSLPANFLMSHYRKETQEQESLMTFWILKIFISVPSLTEKETGEW
jgi:hypothetical protein